MKNDTEKESCENGMCDRVFAEIEKRGIVPRSKWRFLFHDYFVWTVSFLALTAGSISFGLFLTIFFQNDWDIYERLETNAAVYSLGVIPYLWAFFVAFFLLYAQYAFCCTDRGYRHKRSRILVGGIAASAILGVGWYYLGLAQNIDDYFLERVPCYHQMTGNHAILWSQPQKGLLAGFVLATTSDGVVISDFSGKTWSIKEGAFHDAPGTVIKIIGRIDGENTFSSEVVRAWRGEVESRGCFFSR